MGWFSVSKVAPLGPGQIEGLSKLLSGAGTGSDIDRILNQCGLVDESGESTKWRRLNWVFLNAQRRYGCADKILSFIAAILDPARFVGRQEELNAIRGELNVILSFAGLEFGEDGKFAGRTAARTLNAAEQREQTIASKFRDRRLHAEVLKYCRTEMLHDNYFHAVFEATKGLAQRIRDMSGVNDDGATLVDRVFSPKQPLLELNTLKTETERSEQLGFMFLLKGCFSAIRNPLAHEPKILWNGEDDAADYLSLVSLLHRKLDECMPVHVCDGNS